MVVSTNRKRYREGFRVFGTISGGITDDHQRYCPALRRQRQHGIRVLNDRPDVSEENRRRVLEVIESSNYIPNNTARDLVKTKSDAIGLVVRGVSNPFYTDIIRGRRGRHHRRGLYHGDAADRHLR